MKTILVPGGAGFIGSHTTAALMERGYNVLVLDNLSNGHRENVGDADFIEGDIRDSELLNRIFTNHLIDAVIHFAAFIEAGESVIDPLGFYENNTQGSLSLLAAMKRHKVRPIVFSSTAAVYGEQTNTAKLHEDLPKAPINPYGQSKWAVECMLRDLAHAGDIDAIALRYFNAAGSDPNGLLGEQHDPETHLIPLVLQTAKGLRECIKIFGTDYDTPDGTCIRDYIHVCDLAAAHIKAVEKLLAIEETKGFYDAFNLGTGNGFSVREVITSAKRITDIDFKVVEEGRREGDPAMLIADSKRAQEKLGWKPQHPALDDMVAHAWHFMLKT